MLWFWWTYGAGLALATLLFVFDTYLGMPQVARLDRAPWNEAPTSGPKLSVIVPARNEEKGVRACLESLLAQDYKDLEIIAVDDRSEDSTGAIMDELASRDPRLKVIHVRELPPGWLGKPHAMWTGAQAATGSWLLFTDGDVIFEPPALARALYYADEVRADHLVLMPSFIIRSFAENIPLAVFQFSVVGVRPWKVPDPRSRVHLGAGAFNMIRREAYERIGTFAGLRHEIVEDLAVGRLVKESGMHSRVAIGPGLVRLHWFEGAFGIARALTKNIYAFLGFRWYLALGLGLLLMAYHVAPFVCVWLAPGWSKLGYAICLAGMFALYLRLYAATRVNPVFFFLHPIGASLILYAAMKSMIVTIRDGGVTWRGTFYPVAMFKQTSD